MKLISYLIVLVESNLFEENVKNIRIRAGNTERQKTRTHKHHSNTEYNVKNGPINRLQCFFHPRWINCRSRAQMKQRAAPGKGIPICPYGGCVNGKCVEECLFGRCKKRCSCESGWEGLRCDIDRNDCRRFETGQRPCDHRCVNLNGYYRCLCEEGFELETDERTCKRQKSLCDLKNCEMDCYERYGIAHCTCPKPGLKLAPDERTCVDDNECEADGIGLCKTREICVNFFGGYRCDCEKGYARQGHSPICTDIDECQYGEHNCRTGTKCRNVPGFYQCIEDIEMEERDEMPTLRSVLPAHVPVANYENFREEKPAVVDFVYNEDVDEGDYLYSYYDGDQTYTYK